MAERKTELRPNAISSSASRGRGCWRAGYFFLSIFIVATTGGGILFSHHLVRQYEDPNQESRFRSQDMADYAVLAILPSDANAPQTRGLPLQFPEGGIADAGRRMARVYYSSAATTAIVNNPQEDAQGPQQAPLQQQPNLAQQMRTVQYFPGAILALLAIGLAAYAYRLSRQMKNSDLKFASRIAALKESERRFRELAEVSIQGIIVHRDGAPLFVNEAWARIHGFENTDGVRAFEHIDELIVPEGRESVRGIQHALQHGAGKARRYEYRAKRQDGNVIWLECQERAMSWQGKPALQSTIIDVTERKQAEESLRAAILQAEQATSACTRFFAAASHDLRQPLHAISLYLPLLMKRMDHDEGREMLEAIRKSCTAMQSLLDSLLDISRLDAGVVEPEIGPVALLDAFDRLAMEFAPQAEAKGLELRIVPVDYWVRSDPALLQRILRNLLTNAIRYTRRGKILLGARRSGQYVRIEVWDTGIGIDREALKHIFEEFYQTEDTESDRSRGLGLGLAITERIAGLLKQHRLGARSWPGRGSVFDLTLPATDEPYPHAKDAPNLLCSADLEGRRALLIDDDAVVLEGMEAMLQDWGLDVIAASSISDATIRISESGVSPDIVIADLRLRGSESGLDAIMTLNETLQRPVPAIIVTGDTDPQRIEQISASGLTILHKPVEPTQLLAALMGAMQGHSAAKEEETAPAGFNAVKRP